MRIIAGEWRGRTLVAPEGADTRPTSDRARETLFSMLASRLGGFSGLAVADFFAGSGALGLEAMSRGAARVALVERDRAALRAIERNVATLSPREVEVVVVAGDALRVAPPFPCQLILADPPYRTLDWAAFAASLVTRGWVAPGAVLAFEEASGVAVPVTSFARLAQRKVGAATLHLFRVE